MAKMKRRRIKFSIGVKVILLLLVLLSISIISLGILSYNSARAGLTEQFASNSGAIADTLNDNLNSFLTNNEQNLEMLCRNVNITDFLSMPIEEQEKIYVPLAEFQESHPDVQGVYLGTHTKKTMIYPKADLPADFDPTSRGWYQDAVKAGKVIWSAPYIDQVTGNVVITVAKPVNSSTGEFTGVVGADISLDVFMNMVKGTKLGEKGFFFITDLQGNVVYSPDSSLIGKPVPANELLEFIKKGQDGAFCFTYNNEASTAIAHKNDRVNWMIIGIFTEKEIDGNASVILRITEISGIIILAAAIILGIFYTRIFISKKLSRLVKDISNIGNGNFKVRSKIKSRDEIGELAYTMNLMAEQLSVMMKNVMGISSSVATSSDSLAATVQQTNASTEEVVRAVGEVAETANEQARGTETGVQKTNELSESIQLVAEAVENISNKFDIASELNSKGIDTVKILMQKTEETNEVAGEIGKAIFEVDDSTKKIGTIIETIGQIATQTNLLALNASIEAARAGEAGRGFAVVADEIRKLAEQSAEAAEQIDSLIKGIQEQSKIAVGTMDSTKEAVEAQGRAVNETEEVFKQISETIKIIGTELDNISRHNEAMLERKSNIIEVMEAIAAASQQTAASTEEISASTEEQLAIVAEISRTAENLNELAKQLDGEIKKFEV